MILIYIIGIKHVFSILHHYLMDPEGGVETRARNAKVLTTRGVKLMLVYQKTMFDRYFCINSFIHLENLGKNASKRSFLDTIMAR